MVEGPCENNEPVVLSPPGVAGAPAVLNVKLPAMMGGGYGAKMRGRWGVSRRQTTTSTFGDLRVELQEAKLTRGSRAGIYILAPASINPSHYERITFWAETIIACPQ